MGSVLNFLQRESLQYKNVRYGLLMVAGGFALVLIWMLIQVTQPTPVYTPMTPEHEQLRLLIYVEHGMVLAIVIILFLSKVPKWAKETRNH